MIPSKVLHGKSLASRVIARGFAARASLSPADVQLKRCKPVGNVSIEHENIINDLAYCLSFAPSDESSDFARNFNQLFPDERMKQQLKFSMGQLEHPHLHMDNKPLPKTLEDALRPSHRAIVITEAKAPFAVFEVNAAWEGLCGYSYLESKGKTLGSLLAGEETDQVTATGLISQLWNGNEAGATLTNYTKSGRRFRNRIRVGPLTDHGDVTHFIGVLEEVKDGM